MRTIGIRVTVASNGRLLVNFPTDMPVGEYNAVLVMEEQPIQSHIPTSVENAQALFRQYVPASRKLSEELIQERSCECSYLYFSQMPI